MKIICQVLSTLLFTFVMAPAFAESTPSLDQLILDIPSIATVIHDPQESLSAIDAAAIAASLPANNKPQITFANNTGVHWLSFELENPTQEIQTRIFELDYIFIDESRLYRGMNGSFELVDTINIRESVFERTVVYRKPAFELTMQPNSTAQYLVRINILSKANAALELIPKLMTVSAFLKLQLTQNIAFFSLLGLFAGLALYNAILFVRIGEKGYLFYSLYLLTLSATLVLYEGLAFYLSPPLPVRFNIIGMSLSPMVASVFLIAFGRSILQLNLHMPRVNQFYGWAIKVVPVLLPLTLLRIGWLNFWLEISVVILTVSLGVVAGMLIQRGQRVAIYFCISFLFIAMGYTIEVTLYSLPLLEILGSERALIAIPWMEQYFFYTCSAIEVFFLSLALANYIDTLKRDKDNARRNELRQLGKTARLKADYAETLESTVKERTAQLSAQQTKLFHQNEKLLEMDKLKSQFLANISHEFRTPLTLIKGPLKQLANGELGELSTDATKAAETSSRNADRLSRLMEELLTLSHLESNRLKLQVQSVEINSFCRRIASMFEHQALERELTFTLEQLPDDTVLFFDPSKIETVICNLLSNAFKYTPRQGRVRFIVHPPSPESAEPMISFKIQDTGPGIPGELQEKIFDRFYRLELHDRSSVEGSGIGLSLVKELTELHGGAVQMVALNTGGSEFSAQLPMGFQHFAKDEFSTQFSELPMPKPFQATTASSASEKRHHNHTKKTLLLAEDVHDMREYIANHFQAEYNVLTSSDGQQAWEILQESTVDIVITDLMMPIVDGMELLGKIRSHETLKHLPVLMLTARSDKEDRNIALTQQASDYLAKPFDSDELILRVRNLVGTAHIKDKTNGTEKPASTHQKLLDNAQKAVLNQLSDHQFDAKQLALALNVSKPTLHRHLEKAANTTPAAYIRDIRLAQAHLLIEAETFRTIAEVAHAVGFSSPGYFSRLYKQRYPKQAQQA